MATADDTTTSISQLLYTHEKVCNLARGPIPDAIVDHLRGAASDLVDQVVRTQATSWRELARKAALFLDETTGAPTEEFLSRIRDSVHADIRHLDGIELV
jgi:hypothetical protein